MMILKAIWVPALLQPSDTHTQRFDSVAYALGSKVGNANGRWNGGMTMEQDKDVHVQQQNEGERWMKGEGGAREGEWMRTKKKIWKAILDKF